MNTRNRVDPHFDLCRQWEAQAELLYWMMVDPYSYRVSGIIAFERPNQPQTDYGE